MRKHDCKKSVLMIEDFSTFRIQLYPESWNSNPLAIGHFLPLLAWAVGQVWLLSRYAGICSIVKGSTWCGIGLWNHSSSRLRIARFSFWIVKERWTMRTSVQMGSSHTRSCAVAFLISTRRLRPSTYNARVMLGFLLRFNRKRGISFQFLHFGLDVLELRHW